MDCDKFEVEPGSQSCKYCSGTASDHPSVQRAAEEMLAAHGKAVPPEFSAERSARLDALGGLQRQLSGIAARLVRCRICVELYPDADVALALPGGSLCEKHLDECDGGQPVEVVIAAARAEGVREGRQAVDRELLRKVAERVARHTFIYGHTDSAQREVIINTVLAEHTQPAPAESEYQRGVREEREACAKLAEAHDVAGCPRTSADLAYKIRDAIRARSQDAAAQDEREYQRGKADGVREERERIARDVEARIRGFGNDEHTFTGEVVLTQLRAVLHNLIRPIRSQDAATPAEDDEAAERRQDAYESAQDAHERGVREEREACARLAETHIDKHAGAPDGGSFCVHHIVRDIRARSQDAAAQQGAPA